ncbi:MAG: MFS transporter [Gammaproteobacteria bacterium]|nr:MFS transporter [Gammaproteobacteria bacterium]
MDKPSSSSYLVCALLVAGTVLALAGIDLVLPAIPTLPETLTTNEAMAQLVLAAFVLGVALGLLVFGALGARFPRRWILVSALFAYALLSALCALVSDIHSLIVLRFLQGLVSAAPTVFTPVIINALFNQTTATKVLGLLASIESLVPAAAPLAGLWLLKLGGWQSSFWVLAVLTFVLAIGIGLLGKNIPDDSKRENKGSYMRLLKSKVYLRYALSQAMVLAGLLVFVFAAPAVIVHTMDGTLMQFIIMQMVGVAFFILGANLSGSLVSRWGAERVIMTGTLIASLGALLLFIYSIAGRNDPTMLVYIFPFMNFGLGIRGPAGFLRAIIAGAGDDDRASSLMFLAITILSAGGTAILAPFIEDGLFALCLATLIIQATASILLVALPKLEEN